MWHKSGCSRGVTILWSRGGRGISFTSSAASLQFGALPRMTPSQPSYACEGLLWRERVQARLPQRLWPDHNGQLLRSPWLPRQGTKATSLIAPQWAGRSAGVLKGGGELSSGEKEWSSRCPQVFGARLRFLMSGVKLTNAGSRRREPK